MFGLELQTSRNFFTGGVQDREVAYRHDSGLMTLEGDETTGAGAISELEFVTAPCSSHDQAQQAVEHARTLAGELARQAGAPGRKLTFKAGDTLVGGRWQKDCELRIDDLDFVAKPQGTVGIPLARLGAFIERVLRDLAEGPEILGYLQTARKSGQLNYNATGLADLTGFLTACLAFLAWAVHANVAEVLVDDKGYPLEAHGGSTPDVDYARANRIFSFPDSPYLKGFEFNGAPAFEKDGGTCRMLVGRDSPKSRFVLLHRTDFHSMFRAVPADQQGILRKLPVRADNSVPLELWPKEWTATGRLFPFPYRADPPDLVAVSGNVVKTYKTAGWPDDGIDGTEDWWLIEHGPTMAEWWASVLNGRPAPGQPGLIPKDLASPPPGIRGRDPGKLDRFPGNDENKQDYYGMGAFPMDAKGKPPLAVYEHRGFSDTPKLAELGSLSVDKWGKIVTNFYVEFVEPFT
jgi:hypothetical protein